MDLSTDFGLVASKTPTDACFLPGEMNFAGHSIALLLFAAISIAARSETIANSPATTPDPNEWVDESEIKTSFKNISVGKFGRAKIKIDDLGGEPVSGVWNSQPKPTAGRERLRACEYTSSQFDPATGRLTVKFKITETVKGRELCQKEELYGFSISSACRK